MVGINKFVVLVLVLVCALAVVANAQDDNQDDNQNNNQDSNPESSPGLTSVWQARSQVFFPIAKCKNSLNQQANGRDTVKPGPPGCTAVTGRTTFACCAYGARNCRLPVPGEDFKGTGCKYLYYGACCEF